jgi:hypothetical protein
MEAENRAAQKVPCFFCFSHKLHPYSQNEDPSSGTGDVGSKVAIRFIGDIQKIDQESFRGKLSDKSTCSVE